MVNMCSGLHDLMAKEFSANLLWDQKREQNTVFQLVAVAVAELYQ